MIIVNLDVMLAKRKVKSNQLSKAIGLSPVQVSLLKKGHVKSVKLDVLNKICDYLDCKPGDILDFQPDSPK